ncbi:STAS/SEC14 domain-containing protein [Rufibacter immobilis]|uniref:STAS/SEC14 domain-containing protein n=1 Tax=Rufibacter immobilis TaxID=1348778 RepID=UPI0035EF03D4
MVEAIKTGKADLVAFKLSGSLDKTDYDTVLIPAMEEKISRFGKINLFWEMADMGGWKPSGLWEDVKFDLKHQDDFKRIAIVGDKSWEDWMTQLMKPFTSAEIKYFDVRQREDAMEWVSQ